jgi:hypothetical protein
MPSDIVFQLYYDGEKRWSGADPSFQVRGGALKKIAPSEGRREKVWGISCEKSRFYAKKSYFLQLRREARKCLGSFVWKITILRQKIIFFPILREARAECAPPPPPGSVPDDSDVWSVLDKHTDLDCYTRCSGTGYAPFPLFEK